MTASSSKKKSRVIKHSPQHSPRFRYTRVKSTSEMYQCICHVGNFEPFRMSCNVMVNRARLISAHKATCSEGTNLFTGATSNQVRYSLVVIGNGGDCAVAQEQNQDCRVRCSVVSVK